MWTISSVLLYSLSLGVGLSLIASLSAWLITLRQRRNHRHPRLTGRVTTLETDTAVLSDEFAKLTKLVKRQAARTAVAEGRAKKAANGEDQEELTDAEWVKRTNRALALGKRI